MPEAVGCKRWQEAIIRAKGLLNQRSLLLIQKGKMLRQDDFIKGQLVLIGWRYGKEYGGHLASCMIMGCIANRVKCGWGSWLEMIERLPKFASEPLESEELPSIWEPTFIHLLHDVEGIFDGSGKDVSCGALYWADLRRVSNEWFKLNILQKSDQHPRIADMNSLVLFR